jgi:hypothetical protein
MSCVLDRGVDNLLWKIICPNITGNTQHFTTKCLDLLYRIF